MRDHAPGATRTLREMTRTHVRRFPATPDQVPRARGFLAALLDGSPLADDALLCLSELVTNAIQHSHSARPGGHFTVSTTITPHTLRVEVHDEGGPWQAQPAAAAATRPEPAGCGNDAEPGSGPVGQRGRGLMIVAALARWGITSGVTGGITRDGTCPRAVWFELPPGPSHG
jgi:anti-sigma regulatory factor (Ser/Thr protein kinase)